MCAALYLIECFGLQGKLSFHYAELCHKGTKYHIDVGNSQTQQWILCNIETIIKHAANEEIRHAIEHVNSRLKNILVVWMIIGK